MRKVHTMLGVMLVCFGLCACRSAKMPVPTLTATAALLAQSLRQSTSTAISSMKTSAVTRLPATTAIRPAVTPIRSTTVAPTPSKTAGPFSCAPSAPTPTQPPPLWFTAEAKPTQQPATAAMRESQPTPAPVPTWQFTSAVTMPLPCDRQADAVWRRWSAPSINPVSSLLTDRGIIWASTASGVFQINPLSGVAHSYAEL